MAVLQENVLRESEHYLKALLATQIQLQICMAASFLTNETASSAVLPLLSLPWDGNSGFFFLYNSPHMMFSVSVDNVAHLCCNQYSITQINNGRKSRSD